MKLLTQCMSYVCALIVGLLLVIPATVQADIEDSIQKSFNVSKGGTLTIDSDLGSIEVTANKNDKVNIEIFRKFDTNSQKRVEDILEDLDIDFKQTGKNVTVTTIYKRKRDGFFNWGSNRLRLRYVISVPEKYNVDLNTSGGSISVDDIEGNVDSKTSGGSLKFGNIQGPVNGKTSGGSIGLNACQGTADVKTSGGSIHIGQVDGDVDAHTSGGSITIEEAQGSVIAKTSGGSIKVEEVMGAIDARTSGGSVTAHISQQPNNNCRLSTSGGSINVYLEENIKINLDAKTSGGRVKTDFPVTIQGEIKKSQLQAEINGGGPELYLRTSGGNINLHRQ